MNSIGRCWYCGATDITLTDEHVLSEKNFGGRLVAPKAICQPCNSVSGELEDQLARSVGVAELVGRYGNLIKPRRAPRPQTRGILADRREVTVEYGPDGLAVRDMKPRPLSPDPDGTEVWEVAEGQESLVVERRRKRGHKARAVGRSLAIEGSMTLKYGIGAKNFDLWPRFGAKVALSLASIVADQRWLDTPGARALQAGFRHGVWPRELYPRGAPWQPEELPPHEEPASLLHRGEHLVGLSPDDGGCVWMILFGSLIYQLRAFDMSIPSDEYVWLLAPQTTEPGPRAGADLQEWLRKRQGTKPPHGSGPRTPDAANERNLFWEAAARGRNRTREQLGLPPETEP